MPPKKKDDLVQVFTELPTLLEQRLQLALAENRTLLETYQVETERLQGENVLLRGQLLKIAELLAGEEGNPEDLLEKLPESVAEFMAGDRELSAELDRRGEQILDVRAFLEKLERDVKVFDVEDINLSELEARIQQFLTSLGGPLPAVSSKTRLVAVESALKTALNAAERQVQGHQQGSGAQQKWSHILGELRQIQRAGWPEMSE